ncbi:MAG: class II fumarate hydratase [Isosphaeraceae bacterium]
MPTRVERDSMGELEVPGEAYYGAQTERARRNFALSALRFSRSFIRALGLIKSAAAEVNAELGRLSPVIAEAIAKVAREVADGRLDDQFVVDVFQTGSGTSTNMNANEVIAGRANELLEPGRRGGRSPVHPNDAVNLGQSSNDVFPTAIHLAAREQIVTVLVPALERLERVLHERASAFDHVLKIGRTHLQDAVPIRLGQEFSGYATQIAKARARVAHAAEAMAELPLGGTAVGTGLNTHHDFGRLVAARLSALTGVSFRPAVNPFEALANRDAAVEVSGALKTAAVSLSNIANNVRWLASGPRCGLGELALPAIQPGSSIMPAKVNPVIPEAVMMTTARIVGNDATITWSNGLGSNFELNVMMPIIAFCLLESIELLTTAADHLAEKCLDARQFLDGLDVEGARCVEAREENCRRSIERSLAMCTALAPRIGYDNAAALAKRAFHDDRTVREVALGLVDRTPEDIVSYLGPTASLEVLLGHGGYPTAHELESLLDPERQTHPSAV